MAATQPASRTAPDAERMFGQHMAPRQARWPRATSRWSRTPSRGEINRSCSTGHSRSIGRGGSAFIVGNTTISMKRDAENSLSALQTELPGETLYHSARVQNFMIASLSSPAMGSLLSSEKGTANTSSLENGYMHGIMKGEALESPGTHLEWISIH